MNTKAGVALSDPQVTRHHHFDSVNIILLASRYILGNVQEECQLGNPFLCEGMHMSCIIMQQTQETRRVHEYTWPYASKCSLAASFSQDPSPPLQHLIGICCVFLWSCGLVVVK